MDSEAETTVVVLENIINLQATETVTTTTETTVVEKKKKKSSTKKSKKTKQDAVSKTRSDGNKKIHVRSVDAAQVQQKFNKVAPEPDAAALLCKLCNKQVFQMERVKAEKFVWHKNCFTCTECHKKLTVDNYNSHEGLIYCKPHFKQLFQPKAVLDVDEPYFLKPELIIRESQPMELPADVVRASETSSYGMEELSNLDLKSRFTIFERAASQQDDVELREEHRSVKRSESILSRLARFDRDNANLKNEFSKSCGNLDIQDSSSEGEDGYTYDDIPGSRLSYMGPDNSVNFGSISDIKSKWEDDKNGAPRNRREELAKQRKEELQLLRARQCQGRQLRLKEQYEQATQEGREAKESHANDASVVDPEKIKHIKDIFEKGGSEERVANKVSEHLVDPEKLKQLKGLFESGGENTSGEKPERQDEVILGAITKEARNIFKQMEENGFQDKNQHKREQYGLENKETFKSTSAMLDLFRRLEKEPDSFRDNRDEDDYDDDEEDGSEGEFTDEEQVDPEDDENQIVGLTPQQQELLQIARDRAVAKNMREKFERWEFSTDEEKLAYEKTMMIPESEEIQASLNTTKNLRAMFENMHNEPPKLEKPRIKVNRFV